MPEIRYNERWVILKFRFGSEIMNYEHIGVTAGRFPAPWVPRSTA